MEDMGMNLNFWKNKRVFVTGHTGFKGSWLSLWLQRLGADVTGYALPPTTQPNMFMLANVSAGMTSIIGDMRDAEGLKKVLQVQQPDIILHLAAQPLVRLSYEKPAETFETNIMGSINLLEAVRQQKNVRSLVVITSDKCYENKEWLWGYRENEAMGGRDPYSSSKGCVELICSAYRESFLRDLGVGLATARAGNVIGGGDWSTDRLIPDIFRSLETDSELIIRNPLATRPWQHVLESLSGYLLLAEQLWFHADDFAEAWNFGPSSNDICSVKSLIDSLSTHCGRRIMWNQAPGEEPHEAQLLSLDSAKAKKLLGWKPQWNLDKALLETARWHSAFMKGCNMRDETLQQIATYQNNLVKMEIQENVT